MFNRYFGKDDKDAYPYYESSNVPGNGYSFAISIDSIETSIHPLRLTLKFYKYSGSFYSYHAFKMGGNAYNLDVSKYCLGLDIYPVRFNIIKYWQVYIGIELNYLIYWKANGYKEGWSYGSPNNPGSRKTTWFNEDPPNINNPFNIGLSLRTAYCINIKNNWMIVPQYSFYVGISQEFDNSVAVKRSYHHFFEIGIAKKIR